MCAIKRCDDSTQFPFKLPAFSPSLKECIKKDSFYTSSQRNRLIKESCLALRGYCWQVVKPVSSADKKNLAVLLHEIAPKSLGDPGTSSPEVSGFCNYRPIIFIPPPPPPPHAL